MDENKTEPLLKPEQELPQPHDMLLRSPTFFEKYPHLKWLLPLLITLLLLGGISMIILQSQKSNQVTQQITPTPMPSPTPMDPTLTWKEFAFDSLSFKIPYEWKSEFKEDKKESSFIANPKFICDECDTYPVFVITKSDNSSIERQKQKILDNNPYLKNVTQTNTLINGITGEIIEGTLEFDPEIVTTQDTPGERIKYLLIENEGVVFSINISDQNYQSIFDQILSTFKFIQFTQ